MEVSSKKGITSFQLKLLGLVLMTFDHMGAFLAVNTPIWFGWLGRPVATIFLFTSAEGYYYTRNKKKYMLRLLIGFWMMNIGNYVFESFLPVEGIELYANIFGAIFLGVLYMYLYDGIKDGIKNKKIISVIKYIIFMIIPFVLGLALMALLNININLFNICSRLIPTPLLSEGGAIYIMIALLLYIFHDKRMYQLIVIFAIGIFTLVTSISLGNIFTQNYAWMMIFAVIPLYLYNGEKGKSMKYLFYVYYPVHIFTLYIISYFIQK